MLRPRTSRRTAAATAAAAFALLSTLVAAPQAQAATLFNFYTTPTGSDGGRAIVVKDGRDRMGAVEWERDPNHGRFGDSIYVGDSRSDGYAIHGEVRYPNGNFIMSASTSGKRAPVIVRATKNRTEGTKLKMRACIVKGGKTYACSPYTWVYA